MNRIKSILCRETARPLRITFSTSLGQKDIIKSVIVKVTLNNGTCGISECPTSFTLKAETVPAIKGIIREVSSGLLGKPIGSYGGKIEVFRKQYPANPMTISGLETALFRAYLENKGISEYDYWGGKTTTIETDITIPFLMDAGALTKWLRYATAKGFRIFKLKVSGDVDHDEKLISTVIESLRGEMDRFALRLDGNQGYTETSFKQIVDFIANKGYAIELFEQPLPKADYRGLKEIRKYSPSPIILDETVFTRADLERAISEDLCDGVNIKIAKSGIRESRKIFDLAKEQGLKLMIGCMTETMVGLSAGIFFAAGTGGFDYIDLDSIHLLHHKNQYDGITIDGSTFAIQQSVFSVGRH
jgi:L-alanine-DL-glutamate epimerase-like enolase superfamily enzyme